MATIEKPYLQLYWLCKIDQVNENRFESLKWIHLAKFLANLANVLFDIDLVSNLDMAHWTIY